MHMNPDLLNQVTCTWFLKQAPEEIQQGIESSHKSKRAALALALTTVSMPLNKWCHQSANLFHWSCLARSDLYICIFRERHLQNNPS